MSPRRDLHVGGLEPFSAVDWPGRFTATVFLQGCGWRCRYCHNPHLIPFRPRGATNGVETEWTWSGVLAWLRDRRGLLDGVVFSGGEPTLQPELAHAMGQVRELDFRIGLHTGGPVPELLGAVLPLVDWVGFDFKAPFSDYLKITGRQGGWAAEKSLRLMLASGVDYEIRTTWHPSLLSEAELRQMADSLVAAGAVRWVVQRFRAEGCRDTELCEAQLRELSAMENLRRPGMTVTLR